LAITKTSTALANTLPTILESARFTQEAQAVMSGLVWNIRKKLHEGTTVNIPVFGYVNASALTEGVDMAAPTTMTDTNVRLTPAEVGCQILITDKMERDNQEDVVRAAGRILGAAMERKRDIDLYNELVNGTTNLGSGTTMTMGQIAAARATLKGNIYTSGGPAPEPYVMVHHPYCILDIVDVLTPIVPVASANISQAMPGSITDNVLRNYRVGRLFGVDIVEDGNAVITSANSAGGVFSRGEGGSVILCTALEWDIKPDPDPSLRATELNIVGEYDTGYYDADWIVEMYVDATAPA